MPLNRKNAPANALSLANVNLGPLTFIIQQTLNNTLSYKIGYLRH